MNSPKKGRSGLTEKDLKDFFSTLTDFSWQNLTGETIMDIGCGNGENSTKYIISHFPTVDKVIAIDQAPGLIVTAKHLNPHEKIEYHVADVEERYTLKCWEGTISKVVSIYCLDYVEQQKSAFENIYRLLKPGGEAAILFGLTSRYFDVFDCIMKDKKWKKLLKNVGRVTTESHRMKLGVNHYKKMFEDVGFEVLRCQKDDKVHTYSSDDDCKEFIAMVSLVEKVPVKFRDQLKEDIFITLQKHVPRDMQKRICLQYTVLLVTLRKPS